MKRHAQGAFASTAFRMCELGLSPTPTLGPQGKTPVLANYNKGLVNLGNVEKFAAQFPTANIAIVTGPSRLVVLDIDEPELLGAMVGRFGDTPLKVRTGGRGGYQLYYREQASILPHDFRTSEGIAVEIKSQGTIVVAPPSVHLETKRAYETIEGAFDEETFASLPAFAAERVGLKTTCRPVKEGRREAWLFSQCLRHAPYCDSYDELLDFAETRNDECLPPLPAKEVAHAAQSAWRYQIAGRNFASGGSVVLRRKELDAICSDRRGDPLALVLRLRFDHAARCARGDDFALATAAMADADVIAGWSRQNYRTAIRRALAYGWLLKSCQAPARYRFGAFVKGQGSELRQT